MKFYVVKVIPNCPLEYLSIVDGSLFWSIDWNYSCKFTVESIQEHLSDILDDVPYLSRIEIKPWL